MQKWQKLQKYVFIFFLILVIVAISSYIIWGTELDIKELRTYLKSFGIWTPIVFIVLYTLGTIFIPSTPFMAVAGILFGFKYGLLYTIIGGLLSSIIVFNISRYLGKDWVEKILQHEYLKMIHNYNKKLESGAIWDLIILRITPIMPFNILNILMGVSKIQMQDYIIGTIIGLIPSNILAVYVGTFITKLF